MSNSSKLVAVVFRNVKIYSGCGLRSCLLNGYGHTLRNSSQTFLLSPNRHMRNIHLKVTLLAGAKGRGIVPMGEDYGGYDEDKHEEYEKEAQRKEKRIRFYKKIFSTLAFASTLGAAIYARRRRRLVFEDNIKDCTFLPVDENFRGSYKTFCKCGEKVADRTTCVLPVQIVSDGTIKSIKNFKLRPDDVIVASFPKTGRKLLSCKLILLNFSF